MNASSKVVWDSKKVEQLRTMAKEGLPQRLIAKTFGIHQTSISAAMSRHGIKPAFCQAGHPKGEPESVKNLSRWALMLPQ